jgi:hypothetical protein
MLGMDRTREPRISSPWPCRTRARRSHSSTLASRSTTASFSHLVRPQFNHLPINTNRHLRNHQNLALNHESALIGKPVNPERTQTLGAIIGSQRCSLTDLKSYGAAAAQGVQSGGGTAGSSDSLRTPSSTWASSPLTAMKGFSSPSADSPSRWSVLS